MGIIKNVRSYAFSASRHYETMKGGASGAGVLMPFEGVSDDNSSLSIMEEAKLQLQNRRTLMILLGVLATLVIITVVTVLVKN